MHRELVISTVDQGLTSAFSLALSLAFIALATPEEFGRFAILQAALMAAHSLQGPLVLTPTTYLLPGRDKAAQAAQLSMLSSVNAAIVAIAALLGIATAAAYVGGTLVVVATAAMFALAIVREHARTVFFVTGSASQVLLQDVIYVAVAGAAIAALWEAAGPFMASLGGMALASLVSWLLVRPQLHLALGRMGSHLRAYRAVWRDTRWALLGAVQTEAQNRGYLYITEAWRGAGAVGALQAGRLLLSPLWLTAGAWGRVAKPAMVAAFHRQAAADAFRILAAGIAFMVAITVLYGIVLMLVWPLVESFIFGERYGDMSAIVTIWWLYAAVYCVNICLSALAQARLQFRRLAGLAAIATVASIGALVLLSTTGLPTTTALYVLLGAELVMLAGLGWTVLQGAPGFSAPGLEAVTGGNT